MNPLDHPDHDAIRLIRHKLRTDDAWLLRAIEVLDVDDEYLASFAYQLSKGYTLSKRQLSAARVRAPRYARRLLWIARRKQTCAA